VRVIDNLLYGGEAIADLAGHARFELMVDDFRRARAVEAAVRGVEAIVHLGAIVGDAACAVDQDFTVQTNLDATRILIARAKSAGVRRFLLASTCSVYGASEGELDERSPLNPVSLYADTKIAAEEALKTAQDVDFGSTSLRFATLYGISSRPRFDLAVNLLTARAVAEGRITIHGGDQWRPFVHVDDVARATVLALEAPLEAIAGEVFNIGSTDENYRLSRVGEIIAEVVPGVEVGTNHQLHDRRSYNVNFDKLRDRLGFRASHTVRSGVEEVRDLIALGRIGDYRDPRHDNFRYLTEVAAHRRLPVSARD